MDYKSEFDELYFGFFQKLYESCEKNTGNPRKNNHYGTNKLATNKKDKEFNNYINKFLIGELSKYN